MILTEHQIVEHLVDVAQQQLGPAKGENGNERALDKLVEESVIDAAAAEEVAAAKAQNRSSTKENAAGHQDFQRRDVQAKVLAQQSGGSN